MKKNNIENRIYECAICGKKHLTIAERAACEIQCVNALKVREAELAAKKKKAEQDKRYAEVEEAMHHASDLLQKYMDDYGNIQLVGIDNKVINEIVDNVIDTKNFPFKYLWM